MKIRRTVIIIFVAILISGFCYSQQEQPMGELLKEGLSLFKAGEYSGAIEKFDLVIKTENSKEIIPAKLLKGKALKKSGKREEAKTILSDILKISENNEYRDEASIDLAELYLSEKQYYEAALELLRVVEETKSQEYLVDAQGYLENIIIDHLEPDDVDSLTAKAINERTYPFLLLAFGKKLDSMGETKRAKDKYFKVIERYPESAEHKYAVKYYAGEVPDSLKIKEQVCVVGVILPLKDGEDIGSVTAREILEGIKYATDEYNEQAEKKIGLKILDTHGDSERIKKLRKEIEEEKNIKALLGPLFSEECRLICKEFEYLKIPVISPTATDDELTLECSYFYHLNPPFTIRGKGLAQYIFFVENKKKMIVISSAEGYSRSLAEAFTKEFSMLGGRIVKHFTYGANDPGIDSLIQQLIKIKNYEGIYIPLGNDNLAEAFLAGLKGIETRVNIYGNQDWLSAKGLESHSELNNRFVVSSDYFIDYRSEDFTQFNKRFFDKTGLEANRNVLYGYDAAKYLLGILSKSDEGRKLKEMLTDEKITITGIHNSIGLDSGRANRYQNIIRFKNNTFELIDRFRTEK